MPRIRDLLKVFATVKSAYFYRRTKPLKRKAVEEAFRATMEDASGRALYREIARTMRVNGYSAKLSCLIFRAEAEPSFLNRTDVRDISHGFVVIIELDKLVVIFRKHASGVEKALTGFLKPLPHSELSRLFARADVAYERIGMRMMHLSKYAIHSRSYEAPDLAASMSTVGANRAIPTNLRVRRGKDVHSITPKTGRVVKRDVRRSLRDLVGWSIAVEKEWSRPNASGGFMDHFAAPVKLSDLPIRIVPTGVLFSLSEVWEGLSDSSLKELWFVRNGRRRPVSKLGMHRIQMWGEKPYDVAADPQGNLVVSSHGLSVGSLRINKETITFRSRFASQFVVQRSNGRLVRIPEFLNVGQDFLICFSDPRYAYFGGHLYRDDNLLGSIEGLLSVFSAVRELASATDEKGHLGASSTSFPIDSLFGVIAGPISGKDSLLVCDDLGDEWADMIEVNSSAGSPSVSFYVAKHGSPALSASNFHDVVSQAQKNLGRLNPSASDLGPKLRKWRQAYVQDGTRTGISRVIRGSSPDEVSTALQSVLSRPSTRRRMCLVVSFLSKRAIEDALAKLKAGTSSDHQMLQFLWLLSAFTGSCRDAGAEPHVFCRP